jgi:hypothetical protein
MRDDGFLNYLPLWRQGAMGRLQKTGTSQKTCHTRLIFKAFGKKSAGSFIDSHFKFLRYIECRIDDIKYDYN